MLVIAFSEMFYPFSLFHFFGQLQLVEPLPHVRLYARCPEEHTPQ